MKIIIEGSNENGSALTVGSSWTLIYHGTSGLNPDPGRFTMGTLIILPNVLMSFKSYRLLITSKRAVQTSTSCSEFVLIGYWHTDKKWTEFCSKLFLINAHYWSTVIPFSGFAHINLRYFSEEKLNIVFQAFDIYVCLKNITYFRVLISSWSDGDSIKAWFF